LVSPSLVASLWSVPAALDDSSPEEPVGLSPWDDASAALEPSPSADEEPDDSDSRDDGAVVPSFTDVAFILVSVRPPDEVEPSGRPVSVSVLESLPVASSVDDESSEHPAPTKAVLSTKCSSLERCMCVSGVNEDQPQPRRACCSAAQVPGSMVPGQVYSIIAS